MREREAKSKPSARGEPSPLPESVTCPFCSGRETELFAAFGSVASVAQYYCRRCRTVFDYLKWGPSS